MTESILTKEISPYKQGALALGLILLIDLFSFASRNSNIEKFASTIWTNCIAMVLFFIIANALISINSSKAGIYIRDSIYTYIILCVSGALISYFISATPMDDAGSFKWLFIMLTMVYIVFLALMNTLKAIVALAKKQDTKLRGEE